MGGVLRYLVQHGILLPYRSARGPTTDESEWRRPTRCTLTNIIPASDVCRSLCLWPPPDGSAAETNRAQRHRQTPGTAREEWQVLRRDHYPAYISWEQFERNQHQLAANGQAAPGAIRPRLLGAGGAGRVWPVWLAHDRGVYE